MNSAVKRNPAVDASSSTRRFGFRKAVSIAGLAACAMVAPVMSASGAAGFPSDPVQVNDVHVDFGKGLTEITTNKYVPQAAGTVDWTQQFSGGTLTTYAQLTGYVYYDDKYQGGCASIRFTLYDPAGNRVQTKYSPAVCRSGSGAPKELFVNLKVGGANGYRARTVTRVSYDNGVTWTEGDGLGTDYKDVYLGNG